MAVYLLEGALSSAECEAALALFPAPSPGAINVDAVSAQEKAARRSRVSFMEGGATPAGQALCDKVRDYGLRANGLAWNFDLFNVEPLQLAEYAIDEHYDWHLDIGPGPAALRKLSVSIQLTPAAEYDGGLLELWGTAELPRGQGTVVVFPSYLLHRVTPVTRGMRRSLVAWLTGAVPFR